MHCGMARISNVLSTVYLVTFEGIKHRENNYIREIILIYV